MKPQHTLHAVPAPAEVPLRGLQPENLTLEEAARFCRFDATAPTNPVRAFREWAQRRGVPLLHRGRVLLVERDVLQRVLRNERQSVRHSGPRMAAGGRRA